MPVYHFVLHAYGSWHPDNERGWHQHGAPFPLRQDKPLGLYRRSIQRWNKAVFAEAMYLPLLEMARDVCRRREWTCHATSIDASHLHLVVSWPNPTGPCGGVPCETVQSTLKRVLGLTAAKCAGTHGRRWFSDGGRPKRVRDTAHLWWLLHHYIPKQGGMYWTQYREGYAFDRGSARS